MRKVILGLMVMSLTSVKAQNFTSHYLKPLPDRSITISVLPTFGWLKYQKSGIHSKGDFHVGCGITYRQQFSEKWQIAYGLDYRTYTGTITFDSVIMSADMVENAEGHRYYFHQLFNNTEQQKVTYLEPNIRLEYVQPLTPYINLMLGFGLKYGINLAESNRITDGYYIRNTYFYENHNFIEDLESMNLTQYMDFLNPFPGKNFSHSFLALGQIGFRFRLSSKWQLKTLLNVQHSLQNVQAKPTVLLDHWRYSGVAASEIPGGVHAISIGAEIGLSYRFERYRRPAKIQSVWCPH
jgi:hypothetical protein